MIIDYQSFRTPAKEVEHVSIRWIPTQVEVLNEETGEVTIGQKKGLELGLRPGFQRVNPEQVEACKGHAAFQYLLACGEIRVYTEKEADIRKLNPGARAGAIKRTSDLSVLRTWLDQLSSERGPHIDSMRRDIETAVAELERLPNGRANPDRRLQMRL